ncbi:MAG: hypothetical protein AAAFM81_14660 [Pseudomonadota bacterium]
MSERTKKERQSRGMFAGAVLVAVGVACWLVFTQEAAEITPDHDSSADGTASAAMDAPTSLMNTVVVELDSQWADETADVHSSTDESEAWLGPFLSLSVPMREQPVGEDPEVRAVFDLPPEHRYEALVGLVDEGNAIAAFRLWFELALCNSTPRDEAEFEAGIARMYETRTWMGNPDNPPSVHFDPQREERQARNRRRFCLTTPADAGNDRTDLIKQAAAEGVVPAMGVYMSEIVGEHPDEAIELAYRIWEAGSANGASFLANQYAEGWEGQAPDRVRAAAFGFIAGQLAIQRIHENPYQGDLRPYQEFLEFIRSQRRDRMLGLGVAEFNEAYELARTLLEENPNCCF